MCEQLNQIYTGGHSNRDLDDFLSLLAGFQIQSIADVRRFPSSRKFPHFNRGDLAKSLDAAGIVYGWWEGLGGRRHGDSRPDSPNTGLDNAGFRNYADYMMTEVFREAVDQLLSIAVQRRTAIMCAERFFWKCHRRLISDYLVANGCRVTHILAAGDIREHALGDQVEVRADGVIVYRQQGPAQPDLA